MQRREEGRCEEKARARAEEHEHKKLVAISASAPSRTKSNSAWVMHELEPEWRHKQESGAWGVRSFAGAANTERGRGSWGGNHCCTGCLLVAGGWPNPIWKKAEKQGRRAGHTEDAYFEASALLEGEGKFILPNCR